MIFPGLSNRDVNSQNGNTSDVTMCYGKVEYDHVNSIQRREQSLN